MTEADESGADRAEQLMREHRFAEAIMALDQHLSSEPDDARALLQLGICHLLNRSEGEFAAIYRRAEAMVARLSPPPSDVSRLWALYRSLAAKVSTTALVLSAAASAGCDRTAPQPEIAPETTAAVTAQSEPTSAASDAATNTAEAPAETAATA
ncbi:MAG: tetratricopeptide repeat protein, partial [Deltaproteobacteria bacterium]|nr:tetratricopeptide repeat protein [Deltaproteobacteria bacterium]MBW2531331.1 tetratricopeptide repeat protein [Deltaproteobacteria bacterium]